MLRRLNHRDLAKAVLAGAALAPAGMASAQPAAPNTPAQRKAIVVTGTRRDYDTSIDRKSYNLGSDVQAATGSIGDVLRNIPSVDVDLQGNVSLRGDPHVTILVNGKPTSLFSGPGGGATLLEMPASQYERVEVMTNPSAAFGANGSGGILNLITRKNRTDTLTGSARAALGTRGRRKLGVSTADKVGKLSLSTDLSWRADPQYSTDYVDFDEPVAGIRSHEVTVGSGDLHLWTARVGADLDLGGDSLSAEVHRTDFLYHSILRSDLLGVDQAGQPARQFSRAGTLQQNRIDTEGSLSFQHDTGGKGTDYSANITYDDSRNGDLEAFDNLSTLPPAPERFDNVSRIAHFHDLEAKADLTSPRKDGSSLQAGIDVQVDRDRFDDSGGFGASAAAAAIPDPAFSQLFEFDRTISAAYVIYQHPFGAVTVEAGLRVEDERHEARMAGTPISTRGTGTRLFPSVNAEWTLSKHNTLRGSFSTRIQRPDPEDYDPFRRFVDPFHFEAGNPLLKPETTISIEGGVEHKEGKSLDSATFYYRHKDNGVTDVSEDLGDGVFLTTRENLTGSEQVGLELVVNGLLTKRLSYKLSGNVYHYTIDAANLGFGRRSAMIESGKAGIDWQASKRDLAQVNLSLAGKQLLPQAEVDPMLLVNLGYRHQFGRRWYAFFTAQDALHTYKRHSIIETPTLIERALETSKTQAAFIGLTYDFGGKKSKDPAFDYAG